MREPVAAVALLSTALAACAGGKDVCHSLLTSRIHDGINLETGTLPPPEVLARDFRAEKWAAHSHLVGGGAFVAGGPLSLPRLATGESRETRVFGPTPGGRLVFYEVGLESGVSRLVALSAVPFLDWLTKNEMARSRPIGWLDGLGMVHEMADRRASRIVCRASEHHLHWPRCAPLRVWDWDLLVKHFGPFEPFESLRRRWTQPRPAGALGALEREAGKILAIRFEQHWKGNVPGSRLEYAPPELPEVEDVWQALAKIVVAEAKRGEQESKRPHRKTLVAQAREHCLANAERRARSGAPASRHDEGLCKTLGALLRDEAAEVRTRRPLIAAVLQAVGGRHEGNRAAEAEGVARLAELRSAYLPLTSTGRLPEVAPGPGAGGLGWLRTQVWNLARKTSVPLADRPSAVVVEARAPQITIRQAQTTAWREKTITTETKKLGVAPEHQFEVARIRDRLKEIEGLIVVHQDRMKSQSGDRAASSVVHDSTLYDPNRPNSGSYVQGGGESGQAFARRLDGRMKVNELEGERDQLVFRLEKIAVPVEYTETSTRTARVEVPVEVWEATVVWDVTARGPGGETGTATQRDEEPKSVKTEGWSREQFEGHVKESRKLSDTTLASALKPAVAPTLARKVAGLRDPLEAEWVRALFGMEAEADEAAWDHLLAAVAGSAR